MCFHEIDLLYITLEMNFFAFNVCLGFQEKKNLQLWVTTTGLRALLFFSPYKRSAIHVN